MEVSEVGGRGVDLVQAPVGVPQVGLGNHLVHSIVGSVIIGGSGEEAISTETKSDFQFFRIRLSF